MGDVAQTAEATPQATEAPQAPAWTRQLPLDLQSQDAFKQFGTIHDFARSYLDLQSKQEQAGVRVPGEGATDEEIAAFRQAMGIPEGPDGYEFEIQNVPEDVSFDEFKQLAAEVGLTPQQAQKLVEWDMQRRASEKQQQDEQFKATRDEAIRHLQERHGDKWESKLEKALRLVEKAGGTELRQELNETGIGNNPKLIDTFIKLADMTSEDGIVFGSGSDATKELDFAKIYPSHYGKK